MPRYEYKTLEFATPNTWKSIKINSAELETKLNELGREGWELSTSLDTVIYGYTQKVILILKREI